MDEDQERAEKLAEIQRNAEELRKPLGVALLLVGAFLLWACYRLLTG